MMREEEIRADRWSGGAKSESEEEIRADRWWVGAKSESLEDRTSRAQAAAVLHEFSIVFLQTAISVI